MVSLALDPPPSSHRDGPRRGRSAVLVSIVAAAALAAGFWLGRVTAPGVRASAAATPAAAAMPSATVNPNAPSPPPPASGPPQRKAASPQDQISSPPLRGGGEPRATPTASANPTANPTATASASANPSATAAPFGPRRLSVTLDGALEGAITSALPKEDRALAEELTAVVNRLLVWQMAVARDGRRGDRLDVLWSRPVEAAPGLPASGEPVVHALRYASSKLGTVLATYRFEPKGARWARYYRADGTELEARLVDAPVAEYEQITSLLRDGRRHKGVDFKTPVGSPVVAPFDGVIERRNWHFSANGNCLDVRDPATGRHAIFLHLDVVPKDMQPGRKVRKGETIAASGNSGHSYAPHLHYQLEDASGRVLDPFETLKTERRALSAAEKPAFDAARAKLDSALNG